MRNLADPQHESRQQDHWAAHGRSVVSARELLDVRAGLDPDIDVMIGDYVVSEAAALDAVYRQCPG